MNYSKEVEEMCPVAKGVDHGPAPIPEEGKWVKAKEIIDMLGADRFFFATDFPMWDASGELERFNKIQLTEKEREMIFSENIKRLLNIS